MSATRQRRVQASLMVSADTLKMLKTYAKYEGETLDDTLRYALHLGIVCIITSETMDKAEEATA